MTERLTVDQINSDQLDALYDQLDRVVSVYDQRVKTGPPRLGTSVARGWDARLAELHNAIFQPTAIEATKPEEQQ